MLHLSMEMKNKKEAQKKKSEKKAYSKPELKAHGKLSKVMGTMMGCFA